MHFYSQLAEPKFFVPMKTRPGELRPTRTSDAKKEGWIPSVTTILNMLDKPALINWKIEQHLLQAYTLISNQLSGYDEFSYKVKQLTELEMDKAPSAGTDVHDSLEKWFLGEMPDNHIDICEKVESLIKDKTGYGKLYFTPEQKFSSNMGFAGMVDLHGEEWVIDYKTKQTADKFKPGKMAYPDHQRQLAAYREGLGLPKARCANLFICIENGELDFHEHKEEDLQRGWGTFQDCLSIWKRENYDSSFGENQ